MKVINVKAALINMMCDGIITEAMVEAYIAKHGYMSDEHLAAAIAAHPEIKIERDLVRKIFA